MHTEEKVLFSNKAKSELGRIGIVISINYTLGSER